MIINKKGLDGRLVLQWSAGLSCVLSKGQELCLVPPKLDAPRCVHLGEDVHTLDSQAVVRFDEVTDVEMSELLCGCHVLMDAADIKCDTPEEEDVGAGVVGWILEDVRLGAIGRIISSEPRFEQTLLEVEVDDDSSISGDVKLVPLVDEMIIRVDEPGQRLIVKCPQGLFDL